MTINPDLVTGLRDMIRRGVLSDDTCPDDFQWLEAVLDEGHRARGARPEDELSDLFPGTGAVTRAWGTWRQKFTLPDAA